MAESTPGGISQNNLEKRIVEMIAADYAWEQVIYDLVAAEGLDPWNLDLNILSSSFLSYMGKIKELDFRIPAKYVIISSMILRMKSDNLKLLNIPSEGDVFDGGDDFIPNQTTLPINLNGLSPSLFDLHGRRRPVKPIMVTDLINSLKRVLNAQEMREMKFAAAKEKIKLTTESITERINAVYSKINTLLSKLKNEEVQFSQVVDKWERKSVVESFLPLVYLDNEKKIVCRQDEFFDEIYIKGSPINGNAKESASMAKPNGYKKLKEAMPYGK